MKKYIVFFIVSTLLISCAAPRQVTQLVRDVHVDTLYLSNIQYDSIYVYQERLQDRSRDTIYLKDVSIEYRYKMLRDTVRIVQRDSIPYEVVRIETKEITRPLTLYDKACRITFWFIIGFLIFWFYTKLKLLNR